MGAVTSIIGGGGSKSPKLPPPVAAKSYQPVTPTAAPQTPTAAGDEARRRSSMLGRAGNVLTTGTGLDTVANTAKKSLLGS